MIRPETEGKSRVTGQAVLVMGVSGSGKSTVGELLAHRLGWPFLDADDVHPPANIAKMTAGVPLTDADREPWLQAIAAWLARGRVESESVVVACSALKRRYRDLLRAAAPGLRLVYLASDPELLSQRVAHRRGHFFPIGLLHAQLRDLEVPGADEDPIVVDAAQPPEKIVDSVELALRS
jgi:carbohydrate kinase (thermoresistant glucokinase family)